MVDKCDKFGKTQNNVPKSKKNVICHKKSKKKLRKNCEKLDLLGKSKKCAKLQKKKTQKNAKHISTAWKMIPWGG